VRDEGLPQGKEKARRVRDMFDAIAGRYDLVNRVMTFGMDVGWRRRAVRELRLPGGALVADLACGTGDLCRELSRDGYRAVGFDFSLGMLAKATTDVPLAQADVLRLPLADRSIDGATCGFALRNLVDLDAFFAEIARVVRAGGRISLLEASQPDGPLMRAGHAVYFRRMVPMIGGVLSDREAYAYLPKSMAYLPPVTEMVTALRDAGFTDAVGVRLSGGIAQVLAGTRA
jgi:demethylmenaquinone methyltransferase / 2-methoxy-6-polyprenyl-1,4-benzoquinol methylase